MCPSFDAFIGGLRPDDDAAPALPLLAEHAFWGQVLDCHGETQAGLQFSHPRLGGDAVPIHLGEFEAQRGPSQRQLDGYVDTYQGFLSDIEGILAQIEAQGFADAQRVYAAHYANHPADLPRACPDCLSSATAHMAAMQNPLSLRVQAGKTVRLAIAYALDPEHDIEFKFIAGRLREVAGIAAT